jgi:protein-L-isoaspartate(D-aspartate) O-methyltransferase
MVDYQIRSRGIRDDLVLEAMKKVERHLFVPEEQVRYAYNDRPLPIGLDQTISQPYIVALMTEFLNLKGAERASSLIASLGYTNVHVHLGDGSLGWTDEEPYDAVLVTAAAPEVPEPLKDQLIEDGRLVIPVGHPRAQLLEVWQKKAGGFVQECVANVAFVPLYGEHGWDKDPRTNFNY